MSSNPRPGRRRRWGLPVLLVLVALIVVMGLLRVFFVEAYRIPAGSMIPTLQVGDHIFIKKLGYKPMRGDIVVFTYPADQRKDFVKRIVAIGGDTIRIAEGVIHLNGKPIERRPINAPCNYTDEDEEGRTSARACVSYEEKLDNKRFRVIHDVGRISWSGPAYRVPPGDVYVLGDNRDNSFDSRFFGSIPVAKIKGRAAVIWRSKGHVVWRKIDSAE